MPKVLQKRGEIPFRRSKKWGKLSSDINYRRLELLLLRDILLELKKVNK